MVLADSDQLEPCWVRSCICMYSCIAKKGFLDPLCTTVKKIWHSTSKNRVSGGWPVHGLSSSRHRLPDDSLKKEAMKATLDKAKKKEKKVVKDAVLGKYGKIYVPDQKVGSVALPHKAKGVKRERREAKLKRVTDQPEEKKQKLDSE